MAWKGDYQKIMEVMMNKRSVEANLRPLEQKIEGNKADGKFGDKAMGTALNQYLGA